MYDICCKDSMKNTNTKMPVKSSLTLMETAAFLFYKQKTKVDSRNMDAKRAKAIRFYLKKFHTKPKRIMKSRYG